MRLICVPLTGDRRHEEAIKDFVIDREAGIPKNLDYVAGLEAYLKRCAWDDDMNHDVKIYLIKIKDLEMEGEIVAYFGLRKKPMRSALKHGTGGLTMTYDEAKVKILPYAIYRHYKGNYYKVFFVAKHSETCEPIVIYQDIKKHGIFWARPASMWFDEIAQGVKRFERIIEDDRNSND